MPTTKKMGIFLHAPYLTGVSLRYTPLLWGLFFSLDAGFASLWTTPAVLLAMGASLHQTAKRIPSLSHLSLTDVLRVALWVAALAFALARLWVGLSALFPFTLSFESLPGARAYTLAFLSMILGEFLVRRFPLHTTEGLAELWKRPAAVLSGSFLLLILVGAGLLMLPLSLHRLEDVSFLNALFMATSAVCVTGLSVLDVGQAYTPFGQLVLLLLIQLGAVGIMTMAAMIFLFKKDHDLSPESRLLSVIGANNLRDLRHTVLSIALMTLLFEGVGAVLLFASFSQESGVSTLRALWWSVFHSVSAFANAGFSLFPQNFESRPSAYGLHATLGFLIVAGGLGFPVLAQIFRRFRWPSKRNTPLPHLAHGAKVALKATLILLLGGAALVGLLESTGVFASRPPLEAVSAALFTSITVRTAGFSTVPVHELAPATLWVLMFFMMIGGSPGGTAGGIKTTTAAVLAATMRGELLRQQPTLGRRALSQDVIRKAVALLALSMGTVFMGIFVLLLSERQPLMSLVFEAVSAFGTVGLSTGITASLSPVGKLVLMGLMFAGRVGPLTLAFSLSHRFRPQKHHFPSCQLPVG